MSGRYPICVIVIRRFVLHRPALAVLVLLAVLAMRLVVPAGYMIGDRDGRSAIILCSGTAAPADAPHHMAAGVHHAAPGDPAPTPVHGKPDQPCSFAGLSAPWLDDDAPALPVDRIAFVAVPTPSILVEGYAAPRLHWRPPSQGPPAA